MQPLRYGILQISLKMDLCLPPDHVLNHNWHIFITIWCYFKSSKIKDKKTPVTFFTHHSTSWCIPTQKHLCLNRLNSLMSNRISRTDSFKHAGKIICLHSPMCTSWIPLYSHPPVTCKCDHYLNKAITNFVKQALPLYLGLLFLQNLARHYCH